MDGWRKLYERLVYDGAHRQLVARTFARPDGSTRTYDVKAEGAVAAVLAITESGTVLLVREFRVGPEEVLLELPGGGVEPGQSPEEAARAELLEETGYEGELAHVADVVDCAYSTRVKHAFVATGCRRVAAPSPHDGEFLEVVDVSLAAFRDHLRSGRLTDVEIGYLGLDALGLL